MMHYPRPLSRTRNADPMIREGGTDYLIKDGEIVPVPITDGRETYQMIIAADWRHKQHLLTDLFVWFPNLKDEIENAKLRFTIQSHAISKVYSFVTLFGTQNVLLDFRSRWLERLTLAVLAFDYREGPRRLRICLKLLSNRQKVLIKEHILPHAVEISCDFDRMRFEEQARAPYAYRESTPPRLRCSDYRDAIFARLLA